MEHYIWEAIIICFGVIVTLIGVIYKTLVNKIKDLSIQADKGLELKVDRAEYKIVREWEKEVFDGMKMTIRELKDENNVAHEAIMFEIRKSYTQSK